MLFFTVGSIICATSGNFTMMMTGRVIQAVGAYFNAGWYEYLHDVIPAS